MLKKIKKTVPKYYEVPAPWNKMGFYLEVYEKIEMGTNVIEAWLCKEDIGIKEHLIGLPLEQPDKTYTYHETLEIIENMLTNNCRHIRFYLEDHNPEDLDEFYELAEENDIYIEEDSSFGCPFCDD